MRAQAELVGDAAMRSAWNGSDTRITDSLRCVECAPRRRRLHTCPELHADLVRRTGK
jgi:hypothetical protein